MLSFYSANEIFSHIWWVGYKKATEKATEKGYSYRCVWPAGQGGVAKVGLTMPLAKRNKLSNCHTPSKLPRFPRKTWTSLKSITKPKRKRRNLFPRTLLPTAVRTTFLEKRCEKQLPIANFSPQTRHNAQTLSRASGKKIPEMTPCGFPMVHHTTPCGSPPTCHLHLSRHSVGENWFFHTNGERPAFRSPTGIENCPNPRFQILHSRAAWARGWGAPMAHPNLKISHRDIASICAR